MSSARERLLAMRSRLDHEVAEARDRLPADSRIELSGDAETDRDMVRRRKERLADRAERAAAERASRATDRA